MSRWIQFGSLALFPETKLLQVPLPDGDRGIAVTVGFMRIAAAWGQRDPQIRQLALQIISGVPNNDTAGEVDAIYRWVKSNIAFRGELDETVQTPQVTINFGAGDCDDHSVLVAALLGAIGYQWQFKTVAMWGQQDFRHVYAEIYDGDRNFVNNFDPWEALDTTVGEASPGWEPAGISRAATWAEVRVRGQEPMRGYRNYRRLGDSSDYQPTAADQISEVIASATPLVAAFRPQAKPVWVRGYGVVYPDQQLSSSPQPQVSVAARVPGWVWGLGITGLALYSLGKARGRG